MQEKLIRYAPYFNPWSSIDIENDPGYESFNDIELFLSDNNKKISFVVLVQKNSNTNWKNTGYSGKYLFFVLQAKKEPVLFYYKTGSAVLYLQTFPCLSAH